MAENVDFGKNKGVQFGFSIVNGDGMAALIDSVDLSSEVSSLITLNLLSRISASQMWDLDQYKLRCVASFDLVMCVSDSISVDLPRYLYEQ